MQHADDNGASSAAPVKEEAAYAHRGRCPHTKRKTEIYLHTTGALYRVDIQGDGCTGPPTWPLVRHGHINNCIKRRCYRRALQQASAGASSLRHLAPGLLKGHYTTPPVVVNTKRPLRGWMGREGCARYLDMRSRSLADTASGFLSTSQVTPSVHGAEVKEPSYW